MSTQVSVPSNVVEDARFFDGFTRTMLTILLFLLLTIFASGKYMSSHNFKAVGTDDIVNDLAADTAHGTHHPFIELPGDVEVAAFSVANFFAGLIVGYHWLKLFGNKPQNSLKKPEED
jgi:cobalt/nickel transport protein